MKVNEGAPCQFIIEVDYVTDSFGIIKLFTDFLDSIYVIKLDYLVNLD